MTVKVYGKPGCVQCSATERRLDKNKIKYTKIDVTRDLPALQHIMELGYQQVPVVEHGDDHWGGYRPDLLDGLIAERRAA